MAELEVQIRFRHQGGDIGPLSFPLGTSVEAVKQKVYASWPTDNGELHKAKPASVEQLRLILSGKYVDNARKLEDYKTEYELKSDTTTTMHLIIRQQPQASKPSASAQAGKQEAKGCGCVIC